MVVIIIINDYNQHIAAANWISTLMYNDLIFPCYS